MAGGKIPYGYKNVNKKAVIVPEEADIVRYIYERYSIGVYVKDIIAELNGKGLLHKGKPFVPNMVYRILGNERYSGIYRHNGEVFDNIYRPIVPKETFEKVRAKVNANKFGKRSEHITYLLKDKTNNLDYIVRGLMQEQERQAQSNIVLNLLLKEQRQTENAIQNIMTAIENGGTSSTVMQRMRELEN